MVTAGFRLMYWKEQELGFSVVYLYFFGFKMSEDTKTSQFHEMGLDARILKSIAKLGWAEPTLIQEKAIPLALAGKDILARARTGSGKTGAFAIPIVQKVLLGKQVSATQEVRVLVLAPSKELCKQIHKNFEELTTCCSREVRCVNLAVPGNSDTMRSTLMEKPDVVIGTPNRVLMHLQAGNLVLRHSLETLVVDEADLIFSFGYEQETRNVLTHLPSIYQAYLMSATLSEDVLSLKKLVLHNAVVLKLQEPELPESNQLTQYHIKCENDDKYVIIYTLFKLNLIRGRTIIFVANVDRCYRLRLYLEQFGIAACSLNAEMPTNSRCHIVSQFNEGLYDIIIASDDNNLDEAAQSNPQPVVKGKRSKRIKDKEYSTSRGIDFQSVSNVINFDFPQSVDSYTHRVGRTARGNCQGTALSFVSIKDMPLMEAVEQAFSGHRDAEGGSIFKPYLFKMEEVESFRYRSKDALRSITSIAVRETRLKEIKKELFASSKLKTYFEDNPRDLQILRHDKALHTVKIKQHLKDVPDYIVPDALQNIIKGGMPKKKETKTNQQQHRPKSTKNKQRFNRRNADPLRSLKFSGFKDKP